MLGAAGSVAIKLINRAVTDGWIGVKRHYYLIGAWGVGHKFMAASEYKLNIPGIINLGHHPAPGFLLTPTGAVAIGLYELLDEMGVPITYAGKNEATGEPYNDRWRGPGSRG